MDSLDWEFNQLCRKIETKRRKLREEQQAFNALSSDPDNGNRQSESELERTNSIPLERLSEQKLQKTVSLLLNTAVQDIVGQKKPVSF